MITALRHLSRKQIRSEIEGFAKVYVQNWQIWLDAGIEYRPMVFGRILRKWQATRPRAMRRLQMDAKHEAPFLEDLLREAADPLEAIAGLTIQGIPSRSHGQHQALIELWSIFSRLPVSGAASCVGISKAVMLLTEGRIGPAFDRSVRMHLAIRRPATALEWIERLEQIAEDIAAFESLNGKLSTAVPPEFTLLPYGRLYDMLFGPRAKPCHRSP